MPTLGCVRTNSLAYLKVQESFLFKTSHSDPEELPEIEWMVAACGATNTEASGSAGLGSHVKRRMIAANSY